MNNLLPHLTANSPSTNERQHDRMYMEAFGLLPDAAFLFASDRRLIAANAAAGPLANDTVLNGSASCEMFWHGEGAEGCVVDGAMETGQSVQVEMAGPEADKSISIIVKPIKFDDNSMEPGALVIARDISDLRRAEAEAIAHKSFIASIADRTPDEIYALDREGRITWMNERAKAYRIVMPRGASFLDIVSDDSRSLAADNLRRTVAGDDTENEVRLVRTDGSIRYAEAHTSPLWKEGEIDGVLVFLRDVTERKRERELM